MKIIAVFDVDEEKLAEVEGGSPESALIWCEDSGLYLDGYTTTDEVQVSQTLEEVFPHLAKELERE